MAVGETHLQFWKNRAAHGAPFLTSNSLWIALALPDESFSRVVLLMLVQHIGDLHTSEPNQRVR